MYILRARGSQTGSVCRLRASCNPGDPASEGHLSELDTACSRIDRRDGIFIVFGGSDDLEGALRGMLECCLSSASPVDSELLDRQVHQALWLQQVAPAAGVSASHDAAISAQ